MRVLFDQGVPRGLTASLGGHEVTEARELRWERISNGELLKLAEGAGFYLLVTTDKNVRLNEMEIRRHSRKHRRRAGREPVPLFKPPLPAVTAR
jgi:hypothetical protein